MPTSDPDIISLSGIPSPGQLVDVRRRQWIVSEVDAGTVEEGKAASHLVRLASLDEDGLGEEIEVVWQLEPGARVLERAGMPALTGLDDANDLDAFLDAVRWGAATNADRGYLQAPFRSGVSIEDYQLDPLVRAIDMARTNLLIADDVGLGKTIEAGLVIQEMLIRHRIRTVLILCPASLLQKWRAEMREKFGLDFHIVDTEYLRGLRRTRGLHANPWTSHPFLIASMDWAKRGEGLRHLKDVLPPRVTHPRRFDLLLVDEAHNVAPTVGRYAVESQRTKLVRSLAPHFQHKLFLTATPHDGYTESFTALLELLDDQRFARNAMPDEAQLARVMVRRLKSDLLDAEGKPIFPKRRLKALPVHYTEAERDLKTLLRAYTMKREEEGSRGPLAFVHQLLRKRLASSPAAFAATLERHADTLRSRSERTNRVSKTDDRILRQAIARAEEDYGDDEQRDAAEAEAVQQATERLRPLTNDEKRVLGEIRSRAQAIAKRPDSKAEAVLAWLEAHIRPGGIWNEKRVILFTEYRDTQRWMHEALVSHGFGGDRLRLIFGGMDSDEREHVKAAFQASPEASPVRILLATDAASEGIDLQNHCNYLIHLEIPYNPNVLEQRNGRVDRHGQKASEVVIWHPVDAVGGQGEDIIRALTKLETMRADMGSVNPVIAPQLPELLEGTRKTFDTSAAEFRAERVKRVLKTDRDLRERVVQLHKRLMITREDQHLAPSNVERAVQTALRLAGKARLVPTPLRGAAEARVFRMPPLDGSWTRGLEGLRHPYTGDLRPVTFDHEVAKGRDDVVLVHLNHPLVQMSLRLLRAEIWARDDTKRLHRVAAHSVPPDVLPGPAVLVLSRLVVTGGTHSRLHEELTLSGGLLREEGFRREERVSVVQAWRDASSPVTLSDALWSALRTRFERTRDAVAAAVEARTRERIRSLSNSLELRKRAELDDIQSVLRDLEATLMRELAGENEPQQLSLFTDEERTQVRRDRAALQARLDRIPPEREAEAKSIEARYDSLTHHTFPVAILLLVPSTLIR